MPEIVLQQHIFAKTINTLTLIFFQFFCYILCTEVMQLTNEWIYKLILRKKVIFFRILFKYSALQSSIKEITLIFRPARADDATTLFSSAISLFNS